MSVEFLLYGANGFTGRLILDRALELGLRPIAAGRSADQIRVLAAGHGLDHRIFGLDDLRLMDAAVAATPVVLNAAGPFTRTALPLVEACLRAGAHYLDITGEMAVFERLHAMDADARAAGVMLLPGVGFDVVPTDLLAAHLHRRLPSATRLRLAFFTPGGRVSRGTATTMVENLGSGGAVRRNGRIVRVPPAWRTRTVDFGFETRPVRVTTIPWGDVATAWYSTGIPDVEVYTHLTTGQRWLLRATRPLGALLRSARVQRVLKARIAAGPAGPDAARRRRVRTLVWGEVEDDAGRRAESRMRAPEGYTLTAATAMHAVHRALRGEAPAGFRTPSLAYSPDWILELEGVERADIA